MRLVQSPLLGHLAPSGMGSAVTTALELVFGGGLAGFIYKFALTRAEMQHAKRDVAGQLAQLRQEMRERFDRVDRDIGSLLESRIEAEHWHGVLESTVDAHAQRLDQVERALLSGAGSRVSA